MWKLIACCVLALWTVVAGEVLRGPDPLATKFEQVVDSIRSLEDEVIEAGSGNWPPKFCKKADCPKFDMIEKHPDYEVRQYGPSHWASTMMAGMDYEEAKPTLFMRLYDYIKGKNARGENMDMGVPVLIRIIPGQGPASESNFTMSFFIPAKISDPPQPKDPEVSIVSINGGKAYVRSFFGFAVVKDWLSEAEALAKALPESTKYMKNHYYIAAYSAPYTLHNRHTEIWFVAEKM